MMPRTGTNFLANAPCCHPLISGIEPIHEDFLLKHANMLDAYCQRTSKHWNPQWDKDGGFLSTDTLLSHLSEGLTGFLRSPVQSRQSTAGTPAPQVVVSKTPSVRNLRHFFRLFTDARVILLVRDGRSVVESGCRSFDWDFDMAARNWRISATDILAFLRDHPEQEHRILRVDYESLFANTSAAVERILEFFALNPCEADYAAISALHVSGSSESKQMANAVNWSPVEKRPDFNPLARHENWSHSKRRRFEWLAGIQLTALGYVGEVQKFSASETARQRLLDIT